MEQLDDRDALWLVLRSGVSTSPIITEISGRGLGLAIVQEKVQKLGGLLSMDTSPGRGTSFRMELPVTIATFRGILVQVADRPFIVPSSNMDRTLRVHKDEIKTVENRATIPLDGKALSLVDLARVFGLNQENDKSDGEFLTVAVLEAGKRDGSGSGWTRFWASRRCLSKTWENSSGMCPILQGQRSWDQEGWSPS